MELQSTDAARLVLSNDVSKLKASVDVIVLHFVYPQRSAVDVEDLVVLCIDLGPLFVQHKLRCPRARSK